MPCYEVFEKLKELGKHEYDTKVLPCSLACVKKEEQRNAKKIEREERKLRETQVFTDEKVKSKPTKPPIETTEKKSPQRFGAVAQARALQAVQNRLNEEKQMWSPYDVLKLAAGASALALVFLVIYLKFTELQ